MDASTIFSLAGGNLSTLPPFPSFASAILLACSYVFDQARLQIIFTHLHFAASGCRFWLPLLVAASGCRFARRPSLWENMTQNIN